MARHLSAAAFERELKAMTRLYNAGFLTAKQHKKRYDELLKRLKHG